MKIDYRCVNKECNEYLQVKEKDVNYNEINTQKCDKCKEELHRVWSFNGGIKTGDGYKG